MQFKKAFKAGIAQGEITQSYRVWRQARVKKGGTYNIPPFGAIEVEDVCRVRLSSVRRPDALAAGFADVAALRDYLDVPPSATVWRVRFRYLGKAPVRQPAVGKLDSAGIKDLLRRLEKMDGTEPWTGEVLALIERYPGRRAGDLAARVGLETPVFKHQVRKLKALGLTESLEVGYRLSPRGRQLLKLP